MESAAVGPGKAIDTNNFFVICSNCLGACQGSTGPTSVNPDTGKPYGISFPELTIQDMVRAQKLLIEHLGISSLFFCSWRQYGGNAGVTVDHRISFFLLKEP